MDLKLKIISAILAVVLFAFFISVALNPTNVPAQTAQEKVTVLLKLYDEANKTLLEKSFGVAKGTNAFEAMKSNANVEYDSYSIGVFIKSINSIAPPKTHYFSLYIDGAYASKGISDYTINSNTTIEWKMEKIEGAAV